MFSFFYTLCVLLCEKYNFGQDVNWKWRNTFLWMYLDAKIQSSFSYIWCRVRPAHQRSAPGLGLSGCPHKWNTYGNLPQWSAGLGDQRSQNINILFSIKLDLDLDIFYKYTNQTWYLSIKFLDHSFWCKDITVKAVDSQLLSFAEKMGKWLWDSIQSIWSTYFYILSYFWSGVQIWSVYAKEKLHIKCKKHSMCSHLHRQCMKLPSMCGSCSVKA